MITPGRVVLEEAAAQHYRAVLEMVQQMDPEVPWPRMRYFHLCDGWTWPAPQCTEVKDAIYRYGLRGGDRWDYVNISDAGALYQHLGGQPAKVYRAIVQIRRATEWCLARAEGRARHAQEILRQQAKEVDLLEREQLLIHLQKGKKK